MKIQRSLSLSFKKSLHEAPEVALLGPRQCGKTTTETSIGALQGKLVPIIIKKDG